MIGYIYKMTSPSGRVYIGQTINPSKRFEKYRSMRCKYQPKVYNSLLKYGFENHTIEIIMTIDKEKLNEYETYFINKYDSFKNGMNCSLGGDINPMFGKTHTDEVKKTISEKVSVILLGNTYARKKLKNTNTGEVFESSKLAAESIGMNYGTFRGKLSRKQIPFEKL